MDYDFSFAKDLGADRMTQRVFELAKELEMPTKELLSHIHALGIEANNFTAIETDDLKVIKKQLHKPKATLKEKGGEGLMGARKVRKRKIISTRKVEEIDKTGKTPQRKKGTEVEEKSEDTSSPNEEPVLAKIDENTDDIKADTPENANSKTESAVVIENKDSKKAPLSRELKKSKESNETVDHKSHFKKGLHPERTNIEQPDRKTTHFKDKNKYRKAIGEENDRPFSKGKEQRRNRKYRDRFRLERANQTIHTFNPRKKDIVIGETITVGELTSQIGIKAGDIIKSLMSLGIMASITEAIDSDTALLIAEEYGVFLKVQVSSIEDSLDIGKDEDEDDLETRSPIVTMMGHVDHGKTSLLDYIRETSVTEKEAGGITQHIGAYDVKTSEGHLTFLDTPGHEAFTAMRSRGANVTDIVILVVAADDGPKPQTVEAINHAKAAKVPIIVAINKCDKLDADPDKTIQKLMEHDLIAEEFGGDCTMVKVSALSGDGVDKLLELVHLQAELMELRANSKKAGTGIVIESRIDTGFGNLATLLVQSGKLKKGDVIVVGNEFGRIRAMYNDKNKTIEEAGPSIPVEVLGLNGLPQAGDKFNVGKDEKQVRQIASVRKQNSKLKSQEAQQKVHLENLFSNLGETEQKTLKVIVKTDVIGSLEALSDALERQGNEEVKLQIIHGSVGAISSTDVTLASASNAIVFGFNVRPQALAKKAAHTEGVDIRIYSVIYDAIDDVRNALEGLLEPIVREKIQGKAKIQQIFTIPEVGVIAGCYVGEGKIIKGSHIRVLRDDVVIHDGKLSSLRRFKDEAKEVSFGFECGIGLKNFKDLRENDELESYTRTEESATLS